MTQLILSGSPAEPLPVRWAEISPCGRYRYTLGHRWTPGRSALAVFVLCNPSTADAQRDDPTSRKCDGFAKRWGYAGRIIVNPFAYRATNPRELLHCADPVGPDNLAWLKATIDELDVLGPVVFGWGDALPTQLRPKALDILSFIEGTFRSPKCLGRTKSGQPRHPLMLAYDTPLERWTP